jgi:nicotinate-nucleotide adenylyltransferase
MKTGILGGTFDPVHNGHLEIAGKVKNTLKLDEVVYVPAGRSPFKTEYVLTPAEQRLEMLRLAVAGIPSFKISSLEIERPGPSYTVDTITELRRHCASGSELYFILGWDSLEGFPAWREPSRIIGMCTLVAVPRPGWKKPNLDKLEQAVPGITSRVVFTDGPLVDISASAIRQMVARGEDISYLVPRPVAEYIREHNLYLNRPEV